MGLVTVWTSCVITKCYWEILTSLCNHSSGGMDMYVCHSNYCTLSSQLPHMSSYTHPANTRFPATRLCGCILQMAGTVASWGRNKEYFPANTYNFDTHVS